MELVRTNENAPLREVKEREATCHDCGNIWIKTYKGCRVKHPTCFKCKSKNTTIRRVK